MSERSTSAEPQTETDAPVPVSWTSGWRFERPEFTPFIDTLHAGTGDALRGLFGLPASVPLRSHVRNQDGLHVHAMIGPEGDLLEFDIRAGRHDGWFVGDRFSANLRTRGGARPDALLLRRLAARFRAVDQAENGPWTPLEAAATEELRFAGIRDSMFREVSDSEALVRLGFRCNQKCEFCWQNRAWPDPPDHLYREWVDQIADTGIPAITFSGGEPTIHRQFLPLVAHARDRGMQVAVQTNAVQLAKPGFADKLAELGVWRLFVSFHSHIPEVSDAMTSAPKTHARTRVGIAEALRAGLKVGLNCVVERRNYEHLGDHARAIRDWYVKPFPDNPVMQVEYSHPCAYYREELWEASSVPLDDVRPHLLDAMHALGEVGVPVAGIGTCGFPPCMLQGTDLPIRLMERESENEGDVAGRVYAEACQECAFRPHCLGLRREYLDVHGTRGVTPYAAMPEFVVAPPGENP